jgi:hypothetical protein
MITWQEVERIVEGHRSEMPSMKAVENFLNKRIQQERRDARELSNALEFTCLPESGWAFVSCLPDDPHLAYHEVLASFGLRSLASKRGTLIEDALVTDLREQFSDVRQAGREKGIPDITINLGELVLSLEVKSSYNTLNASGRADIMRRLTEWCAKGSQRVGAVLVIQANNGWEYASDSKGSSIPWLYGRYALGFVLGHKRVDAFIDLFQNQIHGSGDLYYDAIPRLVEDARRHRPEWFNRNGKLDLGRVTREARGANPDLNLPKHVEKEMPENLLWDLGVLG